MLQLSTVSLALPGPSAQPAAAPGEQGAFADALAIVAAGAEAADRGQGGQAVAGEGRQEIAAGGNTVPVPATPDGIAALLDERDGLAATPVPVPGDVVRAKTPVGKTGNETIRANALPLIRFDAQPEATNGPAIAPIPGHVSAKADAGDEQDEGDHSDPKNGDETSIAAVLAPQPVTPPPAPSPVELPTVSVAPPPPSGSRPVAVAAVDEQPVVLFTPIARSSEAGARQSSAKIERTVAAPSDPPEGVTPAPAPDRSGPVATREDRVEAVTPLSPVAVSSGFAKERITVPLGGRADAGRTAAQASTAAPVQLAAPAQAIADKPVDVPLAVVNAGPAIPTAAGNPVPSNANPARADHASGTAEAVPVAGSVRSAVGEPAVLVGVTQPAGRAFAPAIAAAIRGEGERLRVSARRTPALNNGIDLLAPGIGTQPSAAVVHIADRTPAIDTRRDQWLDRLVDRIEILRDAADARDTRVRLIPDALGKIDVAIRKEGDVVHVQFTAEVPATRQLLADAQPRLAAIAETRGVRLGQSSVDAGGAQGQQPRPEHHHRPAPARAPARAATTTETATDDEARLA